MEPNVLFIRETYDNDGDILWSYGTRDRRFIGCSHDHAMPRRIAKRHNLTLRYVMDRS